MRRAAAAHEATEVARDIGARRGDFLANLLRSANPRGGRRDVTVADLLDTASRTLDQTLGNEPLVEASLLSLVAETNEGLGRYPEGLSANSHALELLRAHGGGRIDIADALIVRGLSLRRSGRYKEAELPLREAVALTEHQYGAEKHWAQALNGLGEALQDLGREHDAERMYSRELEVAGSAIPLARADGLANLGVIRYDQGRYPEAAVYLREAVEIRRKIMPPDDPDLLDTEYDYGSTVEENNQPALAEPIFRELLATYTRVLGPNHIDTLMALQGVAHNLSKQKRCQEAVAPALFFRGRRTRARCGRGSPVDADGVGRLWHRGMLKRSRRGAFDGTAPA
jgi:tetratricopeptide (TPR) repeat protein